MLPWPGSLTGAADALVAFLNSNPANRGQIGAVLQGWDADAPAAARTDAARRSSVTEADTTGDGQPELIVNLVDYRVPSVTSGPPGLIVAIHRDGDRYQAISLPQGQPDKQRAGPFVQQVIDVSKDGGAEILYISDECGASTCVNRPMVATWAGGSYRLATPPDLEMTFATVTLEDRDGDGRLELVLQGGLMGSAGAGVQRSRTEIYRWVGGQYERSETIAEPTIQRYFVIQDANAAFLRRDNRAAIALYERAATDDTLSDERAIPGPNAGPGMRAFARFRLLLIRAIQGNDGVAEEMLEQIERQDALTPYAAIAQVFWHTYGQTADVEAACRQATEAVQRQPAALEPLNGWGYANADLKPADVCVVPDGA